MALSPSNPAFHALDAAIGPQRDALEAKEERQELEEIVKEIQDDAKVLNRPSWKGFGA